MRLPRGPLADHFRRRIVPLSPTTQASSAPAPQMPNSAGVEALLARIVRRVLALLHDDDDGDADEDDPQLWAQAEATQPPLFSIPLTADELELKRRRCAFIDGFLT